MVEQECMTHNAKCGGGQAACKAPCVLWKMGEVFHCAVSGTDGAQPGLDFKYMNANSVLFFEPTIYRTVSVKVKTRAR